MLRRAPRLDSDSKLAALLLASLLIAYSWPRDLDLGPNINAHLSQALAIAIDGTLAIDNYARSSFTYTIDWSLAPDGHLYPAKAPGCGLVLAPVVWGFSKVEQLIGADPLSGGAIWRKAILANWLLNAWPSAVCMVLLFGLTRGLGIPRTAAFAGTTAIALGTAYYPFATAFYAHAPAANLIIVAAFLLFRRDGPPWPAGPGEMGHGLRAHGELATLARETEKSGRVSAYSVPPNETRLRSLADRSFRHGLPDALAGAAAGFAVVFDYPAAIAVIACGLSLLLRRPKAIVLFIAGGLVPLAVLLAYHTVTLGSPLATPYDFQNPVFKPESGGPFGGPNLRVLTALLFSPFRGLLFYSPVVVSALPGAITLWRRRTGDMDAKRGRAYIVLSATTLFAWLLLNSSYFTWHGGYTTGPRFIVPAVVLLGPLIASGWSRLPVLTSCLLAVSVLNQLAIATVWLQVPDSYTNPLVDVVYPRFVAGDYVRGNLGMRFGLNGLWSILPVVIALGLALLAAARILTRVSKECR
jgi:hypothetical protein